MPKRFTGEQVKLLLKGYCQGTLNRATIGEVLGIGKTRFFALKEQYRHNPDKFSLAYQRTMPTRLPASVEREIEKELMLGRDLIDNSTLPIATYNYSVIRDRLAKRTVTSDCMKTPFSI